MNKEYYVSKENSDFFVNRPNGCLLTCAANEENAKYICAELNRLLHRIPAREEDEMELFPPITLEDAIKNTESTPKYNPSRKFRKGDKVSPCFWNNRPPSAYDINEITAHFIPEDGLYSVSQNELPDSTVLVEYKGKIITMQACHLELMSPLEEQKLYKVSHDKELELFEVCHYEMSDDTITEEGTMYKIVRTTYWYGKRQGDRTKEEARAAAQAECERLNAEYRKEMEK